MRDSFTCQYCGRKAPDVTLEVDHVVPRSKGGRTVQANLVTACRACNQGKHNHDLPAAAVATITARIAPRTIKRLRHFRGRPEGHIGPMNSLCAVCGCPIHTDSRLCRNIEDGRQARTCPQHADVLE